MHLTQSHGVIREALIGGHSVLLWNGTLPLTSAAINTERNFNCCKIWGSRLFCSIWGVYVCGCVHTPARTHVLKWVSATAVLLKAGKRTGLGRDLICYFSPWGAVQLKVNAWGVQNHTSLHYRGTGGGGGGLVECGGLAIKSEIISLSSWVQIKLCLNWEA